MKKTKFFYEGLLQIIFIVTVLLLPSCGQSQKSNDSKDVAEERNEAQFDNNKQENDAEFLVDAAENNLKQIQLGQLAQQKGTSPHVKELGKMLEDAHTKSQRELSDLAASKTITIPTSATEDVKDAYKDLNEKSGNDFDKAYADLMVNRHKDAIDIFEKASNDSYDVDVKNWAMATLPGLRKHLEASIECKDKCNDNYSLNK
jgi:putative membrane protein